MRANIEGFEVEGSANEVAELIAQYKGARIKVKRLKNLVQYQTKGKKKKRGWTSKNWTTEQDAILKRMFNSGATVPAIQKELAIFGSVRTKNAIKVRLYNKGLKGGSD